jgi:hypothetical protein
VAEDEREKTYYAWKKAGWKFRAGEYYGALCITVDGPGLWADADINRRFPFGVCLGVKAGRKHPLPGAEDLRMPRIGFGLELNAYFGEPNQLTLSGLRRRWTIGLLSWHKEIVTSGTGTLQDPCRTATVRCRPRLVRMQGWDWKTGRALDYRDGKSWRWITSHPAAR